MSQQNNEDKSTPEVGDVFYAKHEKVYPREVHGLFATLRLSGVFGLLGIYYLTPWFTWDDRQAVLFDLPARQFHIFGLTFFPQDFFYLALLMIIAALTLFFITALAGRLWCGYTCPQTVWTEVFLWMERKVEGNRNKQIKLDKSDLTTCKILKKGFKHFLWLSFSFFTGYTFVGYFTPIDLLALKIIDFSTGPWETFWVLFYGLATYLNAGWMREQVCIYMCPYARFQSAMFDKDTLIISYADQIGEPRGPRKKNSAYKDNGLGTCVDCLLCVQVCPTGIDIRDGLQYQCISCASCVDVCNSVMDKMGYEQGLISYTTENSIKGKSVRLLRPRIIVYALLLIAISTLWTVGIITRVPLELDVIRDRNALYRETRDGLIENVYSLRIINKDTSMHVYHLSVSGIEGIKLKSKATRINVPATSVTTIPVRLSVDPVNLKQAVHTVLFHLTTEDDDELKTTEKGRFIGPLLR